MNKFLSRISIRTILFISAIGMSLLLVLLAAGMFWGTRTITSKIQTMSKSNSSLFSFNSIENLPIHLRRHEKDYFLNINTNKANREKSLILWKEKLKLLRKDLLATKYHLYKIHYPDIENKINVLESRLVHYEKGFLKTIELIESNQIKTPQEAAAAMLTYKDSIYQVALMTKIFVVDYKKYITDVRNDTTHFIMTIRTGIIIFSIGAILFTIILISMLRISILSPVNKLARRIIDLSEGEGDLTVSMQKEKVVCSDYIKCGMESCSCYGESVNNCALIAGSHAHLTGGVPICPPIANGTISHCDECIVTKKLMGHEMDQVAYNLDLFISRIRSVIIDVKENAEKLTSSSGLLSDNIEEFAGNAQSQAASAEEVTATMEEISAGVDSVSDNAEYQFDSLSILIKQFSSLSDYINSLGRDIRTTQELSNNITGQAESGNESLKMMNNSMGSINDSSSKVTNIIGIINDISDQINLLSLNASIEAARAGEQGRGFAVVADEISKLADETATSIKEIDLLIKKNDDEIVNGMSNVNSTIESISMIVYGIEAVSAKIDEIFTTMEKQQESNRLVNESISSLKVKSDEVRSASSEQKTAVSEVMKSVSSINDLNQDSAAKARNMSDSSRELADIADSLKEKVDYFKV